MNSYKQFERRSIIISALAVKTSQTHLRLLIEEQDRIYEEVESKGEKEHE